MTRVDDRVKKPTGYPERVNTDSITITKNEAIFLMAHALRMAAVYYQNIPEGDRGDQQVVDMVKELTAYDDKVRFVDPAIPAAEAFVKSISKHYAETAS